MIARREARARLVLLAACGLALPAAYAQTSADKPQDQKPASPELERILVEAQRPVAVGPMPGLHVTEEQLPYHLQSLNADEIRKSHALSVGDLLNAQFQGVSVNDYQGNPFQMDVNFRGFTASPQLGTAQGLSVFMDGVRVNEPFGDVVNWDLLPLNAIQQMDLFPGTNPLFGLNTLGGAISLTTKSGFTAPGIDLEASGGSWGRKQVDVAGGISNEALAGFAALSWFDENGWRDNSPSRVKQAFLRGDWRGERGTLTATALLANNDLIGNGLLPIELYRADPAAVYTSPDETHNILKQFQLSGQLNMTDRSNLTAMVYRRDSRRKGLNGDVYDGFQDLDSHETAPVPPHGFVENTPICQYADPDHTGLNYDLVEGPPVDGVPPYFVQVPRQPLNFPCTQAVNSGNDVRNGAHGPFDGYGGNFDKYPGVVDGTPIAVLSRTDVRQVTNGGGLQVNWNLPSHKFMVGAEFHSSEAQYGATQQLALIDATHNVYADPTGIDQRYQAAREPITISAFSGTNHTFGLYSNETYTVRPNLHLTFAGRVNITHVSNHLDARIGEDLTEIQNVFRGYILCPSTDPASCPAPTVDNIAGYKPNDLSGEKVSPSREGYWYESIDPSFGFSWLPLPGLDVFGNVSRGTRTPSVIELGCAYDSTPVMLFPGFTDQGSGKYYPPSYAPRSIVGPTCALPTTLSGDPFLPQIRATSAEFGVRGHFGQENAWEWNASVFLTDVNNDIYFVGVSPERSYFQNIGKTRREGFEVGFKGNVGRVDLHANYAMTDATFRSTFWVLSPNNSSADFDQNSNPLSIINASGVTYPPVPTPTTYANGGNGTFKDIRVDPGAHMPGVPLHNVNAGFTVHFTHSFEAGLSLIAHSFSYVRGNENNQHQPAGSDQQTGFYYDPCAGGGAVCPLQQFGTPRGRPFTDKGTVPGFVIFNFDLSYEPLPGLRLFGRITNLLDRQYQTAGRLGVNPFAPSIYGNIGPSGFNYNSTDWRNTTFVGPGAPRGFFGGASYAFGRPEK